MMNLIDANLKYLSINLVGNKLRGEAVVLSNNLVKLEKETRYLVNQYFLSGFNSHSIFSFSHISSVNLNTAFTYINEIFQDNSVLHKNSKLLAKYLYENSTHSNIKGGEFYTAYFEGCIFNNETVDAIGLFKTEVKDDFLKVEHQESNFNIFNEKGININNLDKGCLIFNVDAQGGYCVVIIDRSGKGTEAQYWKDGFLGLQNRNNDYSQTKDFLSLYRGFVTDYLPKEAEISKIEQATLLNDSISFFKNEDVFEKDSFYEKVLVDKNKEDLFNSYLNSKSAENGFEFSEKFEISDTAVKKQTKNFKKHIRLDDNVDILIRSSKPHIEKGEDEHGQFYKIYFDVEK